MRAYLELVRIPNVFTAMADILLGYLFTHVGLDPPLHFVLLLSASCALYMAGMVFNDFFDREQDARERPARPIPSGRIASGAALALGSTLLVVGVALAWLVSSLSGTYRPAGVAMALAAAVLAYDSFAKRTLAGPLVMGVCRSLNVLLGMSLAAGSWLPVHWVVAAGVGVYIAGVTLFARNEARTSGRVQLAAGLVILLAGVALLGSLPAWATGREFPPLDVPQFWALFWGLLGLMIATRCLRAVIAPAPHYVQAAVRNCIFALVILDAGAVLAVQDRLWAVAIVALLAPMLLLGRWIYST